MKLEEYLNRLREDPDKKDALNLLYETDFVDRATIGLKEEIQPIKSCPFCDIDDGAFVNMPQTKQALFYKFKKCNKCLAIYPYPRPAKRVIEDFAKSEVYSEVTKNRLCNARNIAGWEKEFLNVCRKGDKVLDVGAGIGIVTQKLIEKGCEVEAVEINPFRARYLREKFGIKVYDVSINDAALQKDMYDVVILSKVLMYIFSLKDAMDKIRYVLRPGGIVCSSQLNFNSILRMTLRSPSPLTGFSAFRMSSYLTEESGRRIFEKSGFKIVKVSYTPNGLLEYLFVGGYPGNLFTKSILRITNRIIRAVLTATKTTEFFSIIAQKAT